MEGYVITMKEQEGNGVETAVLGVFENKEDVWHLLFEFYNTNEGKFEKQSLNQFENSQGAWEMEDRYLNEKLDYQIHSIKIFEKDFTFLKNYLLKF